MANLLRKGDRSESAVRTVSTRTTTAAPITSNATALATGQTFTKKSNVDAATPWDVAQRWVQTVTKEDATRKQWTNLYGWMADFDSQGRLKEKKVSEDISTRFSNKLPNTGGHSYGWRLHSASGEEIRNMQRRFDHQYRKPVHTHFLGYDW